MKKKGKETVSAKAISGLHRGSSHGTFRGSPRRPLDAPIRGHKQARGSRRGVHSVLDLVALGPRCLRDLPALQSRRHRKFAARGLIEALAEIVVAGFAGDFLPFFAAQLRLVAFAEHLEAVLQIAILVRVRDFLLFVGAELRQIAIAGPVKAGLHIVHARRLGHLLPLGGVKLRLIAFAQPVHAILEVAIPVGSGNILPLAGIELAPVAVGEAIKTLEQIVIARGSLDDLLFLRGQQRFIARGIRVEAVRKRLRVRKLACLCRRLCRRALRRSAEEQQGGEYPSDEFHKLLQG